MSRTTGALAALLVLTPACAEDSSFVLRWNVGRTADDAKTPLTSVRQCSDLGLSRVVVTTIGPDGSTEDTREFPCFPDAFADPNGAAPGPELPAGTYNISIVGLTRRGIERPDPAGDGMGGDDFLARDQQKVVVNERGEGVLVDGFRLVGIDECHDGIDNDRDGAVDQSDTPCRLGQTAEDLDISGALFTFTATLLGANPEATCASLGVSTFRVTLDEDPANIREIPCTLLTQSFSADLPPGEHTWQVEALRANGTVLTEPQTGEPFTVPEREFVLVPITADFTIDTFLGEPAFSEPLRFTLEIEPYPGAPLPRHCEPEATGSTLWLQTIGLTLQGATADDPETFEDVALPEPITIPAIGDPPVEFPLRENCREFEPVRTTSEIPWSAAGYVRYRLIAEAFPVGAPEPCFAATAELAPGKDVALTLTRVSSTGACSDCPMSQSCDNCVDGVCMP